MIVVDGQATGQVDERDRAGQVASKHRGTRSGDKERRATWFGNLEQIGPKRLGYVQIDIVCQRDFECSSSGVVVVQPATGQHGENKILQGGRVDRVGGLHRDRESAKYAWGDRTRKQAGGGIEGEATREGACCDSVSEGGRVTAGGELETLRNTVSEGGIAGAGDSRRLIDDQGECLRGIRADAVAGSDREVVGTPGTSIGAASQQAGAGQGYATRQGAGSGESHCRRVTTGGELEAASQAGLEGSGAGAGDGGWGIHHLAESGAGATGVEIAIATIRSGNGTDAGWQAGGCKTGDASTIQGTCSQSGCAVEKGHGARGDSRARRYCRDRGGEGDRLAQKCRIQAGGEAGSGGVGFVDRLG